MSAVLEQAWPFIGMYMEKLLREKIQPSIRSSNPALKVFTFTKIHFGYKPLKITGIRAYTHEVEHREVILDMNISYDGDVDMSTDVSLAITTRVKGLKLQGMLRVILEPLIGQAPLVGGVTFFFLRRPVSGQRLSHSLIMTSGALYSLSEETILDAIASIMVLPNHMCIPLIDKVKGDQMRFPLPHGVVRVHLLEARDLVAKNTHVMNLMKAKSDRYATLRVGSTHFKSKTVKENLFPKWNEVYEFIVHEAPGQELELELCNEGADKDDCLGRYNLDFGEVKREKQMDQWFPVDRALHGEVHLKLQWFSLQTDTSLLKESTDNFACAVLAVYLHSAADLPLTKRTTCPNSFVEMSIDDDVKKSEVAYASKDPVWEKGFTFFVHNVSAQELIVQSPAQNLQPDSRQRFMLERSGANSQIKLRATLRAPENRKQSSSSINLRRFDSHSLLLENVINSSRFDLSDGASYPEAIRNHLGSFGEIALSVQYAAMRNKLMVFVNNCRNLFPCSENGTDSYVRLYLLPVQSLKHRKRTGVKKRAINPIFCHRFQFDVTLREAQTRKLYVSVKSNKMLVSREKKGIGLVCYATSGYELTLLGLKKSI
uniref:extended synaptotagmin-2-like n=1 Tax=Maylandia zebra TaxID=106582 RepID=UPI000D300433|nr:extended synaptotagmin-2-like [Maylandia zebra]